MTTRHYGGPPLHDSPVEPLQNLAFAQPFHRVQQAWSNASDYRHCRSRAPPLSLVIAKLARRIGLGTRSRGRLLRRLSPRLSK
jgi:hypothetical protein